MDLICKHAFCSGGLNSAPSLPIALALLLAIALGILRVLTPIALPILGIALGPVVLCAPVVVSIIRVTLALLLLPMPPSLFLATLVIAVALIGCPCPGLNRLPARSTPLLHRLNPRPPRKAGKDASRHLQRGKSAPISTSAGLTKPADRIRREVEP
jgi:hypothetical protein